MADLAIKGHETRGGEVIEILSALGGLNTFNYGCITKDDFYYIGNSGIICKSSMQHNRMAFTLEEFLEKFPYKVGDKVIFTKYGDNDVVTVESMSWTGTTIEYNYNCGASCLAKDLKPYKEETMEERKYADLRIDVDQDDKLATEATIDGNKITPPDNYLIGKITKVDNGILVEFVKKQQQYPKDYVECCDVMGYRLIANTMIGHKASILETFQKLLICRDAYWKLAGEQMGLGKPWQPDYTDESYEQGSPKKYVIYYTGTYITKGVKCTPSHILAFPTEEMRDAFYENFKDLIESCKELL